MTAIASTPIKPALKTTFLSHGTLGSKDLDATRKFYEEFLGLKVIRTSTVSLMIRLGGNIFFMLKLSFSDGLSVQQLAGAMTGMTAQQYAQMLLDGGRLVEGNRSKSEWANG